MAPWSETAGHSSEAIITGPAPKQASNEGQAVGPESVDKQSMGVNHQNVTVNGQGINSNKQMVNIDKGSTDVDNKQGVNVPNPVMNGDAQVTIFSEQGVNSLKRRSNFVAKQGSADFDIGNGIDGEKVESEKKQDENVNNESKRKKWGRRLGKLAACCSCKIACTACICCCIHTYPCHAPCCCGV